MSKKIEIPNEKYLRKIFDQVLDLFCTQADFLRQKLLNDFDNMKELQGNSKSYHINAIFEFVTFFVNSATSPDTSSNQNSPCQYFHPIKLADVYRNSVENIIIEVSEKDFALVVLVFFICNLYEICLAFIKNNFTSDFENLLYNILVKEFLSAYSDSDESDPFPYKKLDWTGSSILPGKQYNSLPLSITGANWYKTGVSLPRCYNRHTGLFHPQ